MALLLPDMEYWKLPSRRFYIAACTEFQNLHRTRGKALTLPRKRRRNWPHEEEDSGEESVGLGRVVQDLETVGMKCTLHVHACACTRYMHVNVCVCVCYVTGCIDIACSFAPCQPIGREGSGRH